MIFNPFEISQTVVSTTPVVCLSWAPPQLQDIQLLVLLVMAFVLADLLAWHPKGVMMRQLTWLGEVRSARTFEASAVVYPWLKPLLIFQYFFFFGLTLLCLADPQLPSHLLHPSWEVWQSLLPWLAAPLLWGACQHLLFNWFCYLFCLTDSCTIMNRTFLAFHILLAPLSMLAFIGVLAGSFQSHTTMVLLAALFILSQIAFIFNGFRIFCSSFLATLLVLLYLCTLEIAPMLVIYAYFVG